MAGLPSIMNRHSLFYTHAGFCKELFFIKTPFVEKPTSRSGTKDRKDLDK